MGDKVRECEERKVLIVRVPNGMVISSRRKRVKGVLREVPVLPVL